MLVPHDSKFRRVWMFPRNIRKLYPWKVAQVLRLVRDHLNGASWSGDIGLQDRFCKALEAVGLKRAGEQYDLNSGGPRTYMAQLRALGLIFNRPDHSSWLTIAGQELIEMERPLEVMQTQLLRHQYPSEYGRSSHVGINPALKIKPYYFLLRLARDPDLNGLTTDEMMIPVIYGHNDSCYDLCKEKILEFRQTGKVPVDNPSEDLYTPRGSKRGEADALEDIGNIANTFKNGLEATCLVEPTDSKRYVVSESARDLINRMGDEFGRYLEVTTEEQFARTYGRFDKQKDTRRLFATEEPRKDTERGIILASFFELAGTRLLSAIPGDFLDRMKSSYGFSSDMVAEAVNPFLHKTLSIFEQNFLSLSTGGAPKGIEFEKATEAIFRERLEFKTVHTGQKRRPSGIGGYADILLIPLESGKCAIVDTKASSSYSLGASDSRAMILDYTKNYREVAGDLELEFCTYVAGGFSNGIDSRLKEVSRESGVPTSAITAKGLLAMAKEDPSDTRQVAIRESFSRSGLVRVP